jgi:hypothetical protein
VVGFLPKRIFDHGPFSPPLAFKIAGLRGFSHMSGGAMSWVLLRERSSMINAFNE